jgi:hypothetical protein
MNKVTIQLLIVFITFIHFGCKPSKSVESIQDWIGNYSADTTLGTDPVGASIILGYTISINKDSIIFSGEGYQTYFTDICSPHITSDTLFLFFEKTLTGDDDHSKISPLIKIYKKNNHYFAISKLFAFQSQIELKKE